MVQYELPSQGLSLARLFSSMEEAQRDLQVEDYSICQNTLDNVSTCSDCVATLGLTDV